MVTAINSNTGSEYDLSEDTYAKDHRIYRTMIQFLIREKKRDSMKELLLLPERERHRLVLILMRELRASETEASKFLRL